MCPIPACLLEMGHLILSSLGLGLKLTLSPLLLLRPSNLDRNYTISSPGFPACRWQITGLLSLHNHVSQFFIINLSQ